MAAMRLRPEDQDRVTALFDELYEPMRRLLSRLREGSGSDPSSDRDIVMGAFEAAIENWDEFSTWDERHQRAWLFTVCRNHRIDELRRRRRLRELLAQVWVLDQTLEENPEQVALDRLALAKCAAVLRSMPRARREVATMEWLLQMPRDEIAKVLGMRPGTIRVHLSHARKTLREEVGPYLSFPVSAGNDDGPKRREHERKAAEPVRVDR
ncbi:sigma-70 family RNA polymerase sigma factor (plasmid) [Streptomyces sp. NBC_01210]|uniref:RNA polymerase sigma factor n=1 Tax=Streptomyces sp. NBC_01210 TaxID=2903774 RepID=UPI002E140E6A|nr:sigma-70 family RNA polymerase sigma factor [Streptomyces sp. NBC_01210]